jgi:hypothetical protein
VYGVSATEIVAILEGTVVEQEAGRYRHPTGKSGKEKRHYRFNLSPE